jgi:hypothetical protein
LLKKKDGKYIYKKRREKKAKKERRDKEREKEESTPIDLCSPKMNLM